MLMHQYKAGNGKRGSSSTTTASCIKATQQCPMAMLEVKKSLAFANGACGAAIACLQAETLDLPLPQHQSTAGPKSLLC